MWGPFEQKAVCDSTDQTPTRSVLTPTHSCLRAATHAVPVPCSRSLLSVNPRSLGLNHVFRKGLSSQVAKPPPLYIILRLNPSSVTSFTLTQICADIIHLGACLLPVTLPQLARVACEGQGRRPVSLTVSFAAPSTQQAGSNYLVCGT